MGQPELATDPRFADVVSRHHHQDDLEPMITAWTAQHTERELMERLQAVDVPAGIVSHQPEMFDDPHLVAREFFEEIEYPEVPKLPYAGPMAKFEHMPLSPLRGPAATLGQHNEEVLKGLLGVSDERYRDLEEREIIGTTYLESAT
jgi:crotonobetainyl-CoA:carnitine CoA-transferase CaiB-like acyl-CoA transferase